MPNPDDGSPPVHFLCDASGQITSTPPAPRAFPPWVDYSAIAVDPGCEKELQSRREAAQSLFVAHGPRPVRRKKELSLSHYLEALRLAMGK